MAWGQYRLFLLFLAAAVLVLNLNGVSAGDEGTSDPADRLGEWVPIKNLKDPHVQGLGEYAVRVHNERQKTELRFQVVYGGYYQHVDGFNYRIFLEAVDGEKVRILKFEALVWEKKSLNSFHPIDD